MRKFLLVLAIAGGLNGFCADRLNMSDSEKALQLINHVNWVVSRVLMANDALKLEDEYESINQDALYLDCIKDPETVTSIKQLLAFIMDMRIDAGERELLKEIQQEELANAFANSLPSLSSLAGGDIFTVCANLALASVSSAAAYKKAKDAINRKAKRDTWNLDKEKMRSVDKLNQELFDAHWTLVQRYNLNDEGRVTKNGINELIERLKDSDKRRKFEYLKAHRRTYEKFPAYWYYRGVAAMEIGEDEEALNSFDEYEKVHLQILRKDKTCALAAMNKVNLLIKKDSMFGAKAIRTLLWTIESNAAKDDWNLLLYCASVYYGHLNDSESARRVLAKAINELTFQVDEKMARYRGLFADDDDEKKEEECMRPLQDALLQCRTLKADIDKKINRRQDAYRKMFDRLVAAENVSNQELLHYFGQIRTKEAIKRLKPILSDTTVYFTTHWGRKDTFCAVLPIRWFLLSDLSPKLTFLKGQDQISVVEEERSKRSLLKKYVVINFREEGDALEDAGAERMVLELKDSKGKGVEFVFDMKALDKKGKIVYSYDKLKPESIIYQGVEYNLVNE